MKAGVAETEPNRIWFGRGGCVEQHDDGRCAVFVRGELLGMYASDDVASRDVYLSVVLDQASREDLALAFRTSVATVGRVATRRRRGGARAVADYGQRGGRVVRTPKLVERLGELFEKGLGPRAAHAVVARQASYETVQKEYRQWIAGQEASSAIAAVPEQPALALVAASDQAETVEGTTTPVTSEAPQPSPGEDELTLEQVAPPAGAVVRKRPVNPIYQD